MKKLVLVFIGLLSVQLFAQGPGEPFNPMTANGAEGISFWSHTLLWQNPVNVVYNKVFFSDDLYLVNALDSSVQIFNGLPNNSIEEILLNSNQLDPYTKYYWRVVEYDSSNFTNGPVWYFRTMPHPSEFIHTEDFSSLSNNWQITNDGGTCVWEIHNAFKYTLPSTATGNVLAADADYCGSGSTTMTSATLTLLWFPGYPYLSIEWDNDWQAIGPGDSGLVQVSFDNHSTWQTVKTFDFLDVRNSHEIIEFISTGFADNVSIKFKSIQPGWDWWWAIDNVTITSFGPLTPSYPPGLLRAQADSTVNGVYLSWNSGSSPDNIIGYRIQRKNGLPTDASSYTTLTQTNSTTFNIIDQNIEVNKNYTYRIQTISGPGWGSMWGNEATAYVPSTIPVELTSFTSSLNENDVTLNWQTATETNNSGFQVERSKMLEARSEEWENIGFVNGTGTTTEPQSYSFIDKNMEIGKYQYRLKQMDYDGSFEYSNTIEVEINTPLKFSLEQNYPNPFNPSTTIKFSIPAVGTRLALSVQLKVYDVLGNEIATLVNEEKPAGNYEVEFNSVETLHATSLPSGVYFYQLKAEDFIQTNKMILLK
jgi:hypothetical protein